jgi:hypothetical protein
MSDLDSYNKATLDFLESLLKCREKHVGEALGECNERWRARLAGLLDDPDGISESDQYLLRRIEYGRCSGWAPDEGTYGFRIVGTDILVSDALHVIEDELLERLPPEASERHPELSHDDWAAIIRFTIDVLSVLDRKVKIPEEGP